MTAHASRRSLGAPVLLRDRTVGVVGLGQIGGSVVRCLARYRQSLHLFGTDRNAAIASRARRYCRWRATLAEIVRESDLLVLAVPVPQILALLPLVADAAAQGTRKERLIVTDTGTVKTPVIREAGRHRRAFDFVGLHPLAGTERNGWDAARSGLFENDPIICCARGQSRPVRVALELIRLLGARPLRIDSVRHDRLMAETIGLPHLLAFAAQGLPSRSGAIEQMHGRSWGTLTRVAASDPAMVGGFLYTNAKEQLRVARNFQQRFNRLLEALKDPTGRSLQAVLRKWRSEPGT